MEQTQIAFYTPLPYSFLEFPQGVDDDGYQGAEGEDHQHHQEDRTDPGGSFGL